MKASPRRPSSSRHSPHAAIFDVLGLGCVAVDDLLFITTWPPQDTKTPVRRRERHCGGLTATALVTVARLGLRAAYAGVLGDDELSRFVLETLRREHIHTGNTAIVRGARPVESAIVVDETAGTRNIFYSTEGVIGAGPRHPAEKVIRASRVLFVDRFGMAGMIRAARVAQAAGIPVVADLENSDVPRFRELFRLADHLIVSREFALRQTGADHPAAAVARLLVEGRRKVVVVTCGEQGCWFQQNDWRLPSFHPAFRVAVIDTTGCGDVFHGAYAAGLAAGLPLVERIQMASAAAALKARRAGGQAGIPTRRAVAAFLRKHR